jgi:hypothetical protein
LSQSCYCTYLIKAITILITVGRGFSITLGPVEPLIFDVFGIRNDKYMIDYYLIEEYIRGISVGIYTGKSI